MSRIGKKPIVVPKGVTVKIGADALDIQGPKGKLTQRIPPGIAFELADGQLQGRAVREDPELGKFHGLARSLVANGVVGVTEGFKRELDIVGVGYRAEVAASRWCSRSGTRTRWCSTCRRASTSRSTSRPTSP